MTEAILEPDLPIIDPHHHLWDRTGDRGGDLPPPQHGFEAMLRTVPRYLLDELLADMNSGHNVIGTVFVECGAMYRAGRRPGLPSGRRDRVRQRRRGDERQRHLRRRRAPAPASSAMST